MGMSRAGQAALLLFGSLVASPASADFGDAFSSPRDAAEVNERTVGVVFERDARLFDLLEDIESSLSLAAGLRIVPIVGRNHVQNVYDLLYLDGVDIALVRVDSIEYARRVAGLEGVRRLVRDVASIGSEKIAVIANEAYTGLDDLAGLPLAFGRAGSGEFVTGTLLFDALGIEVRKVEAAGEEALGKVRSGELAAMVHLLDSPGAFPANAAAPSEGVHVLPLPRDGALSTLYRLATLDAEDLPGLIDAGAPPVPSYSIDVNLIAYAWRSENERTRRVGRFVAALIDRLDALQGGALQPEWEQVKLETATPNIERSPMVERALAEREAALERWHRNRALAERDRPRDRAARVERAVPWRTGAIVRPDGGIDLTGTSEVGRVLDELGTPAAQRQESATVR